MAATGDNEINDTWRRFLAHWAAATLGYFIRAWLPTLLSWNDPKVPVSYPRWWVALLTGAVVSLIGSAINSNMPVKPREMLKSLGLGFALNAVAILAKVG
jgi:hypothetical protein